MGLMHGHFQHKDGDLDLLMDGEPDRINAGIGIVIPIWKVVEIIEQPAIRQKDDAAIRALQCASLPTMDGPAQQAN